MHLSLSIYIYIYTYTYNQLYVSTHTYSVTNNHLSARSAAAAAEQGGPRSKTIDYARKTVTTETIMEERPQQLKHIAEHTQARKPSSETQQT